MLDNLNVFHQLTVRVNVKVVQPTVNYFVQTQCILLNVIEMIQVKTNTSFISC
jgi:hypothetical protein